MNHNVDSMGVSQCTIFSLCQNGRGESEMQGWGGIGGGGGGGGVSGGVTRGSC